MHCANKERYQIMEYRRCGNSGLKLPIVSLGLWQNFGSDASYETIKDMITTAFDLGITHFDLANNYGPVPGSAEFNFGKILRSELSAYRDEMIISTKAGYEMWDGPYGNWGSRKYLFASLDQSLSRMGIPYVDIFYHHRPDPDTPLEETAEALSDIVRQGKALYVGISNYHGENALKMMELLSDRHTPCILNQNRYNLLEREPEDTVLPGVEKMGSGCIVFSPLAQGVLTDKYSNGIPKNSRAEKSGTTVRQRYITEEKLHKVNELSKIAKEREETMAQMSLAWVLRKKEVVSVLIGASSSKQIIENVQIVNRKAFSEEHIKQIDFITQ